MSRYDDMHYDCRRWTNRKLMVQARKYANLESFGGSINVEIKPGFPNDHGPEIREATRLYRDSWLKPILDEIERRFVKVKG